MDDDTRWDLKIGRSRVRLTPGDTPDIEYADPGQEDPLALELCRRAGHDPHAVVLEVMWAREPGAWSATTSNLRRPLWTFYWSEATQLRRRLAGALRM